MTDTLRDRIASEYSAFRGIAPDSVQGYVLADAILDIVREEYGKQPSGLKAERQCHGDGFTGCVGSDCPNCHGTGTITRDISVDEVLEDYKKRVEFEVIMGLLSLGEQVKG